ncbi:MAG: NADH:ubiquinone reductase (Na(+)-transporting) subunit C [Bacteroidaceae bacterium]|nr:NADH:ubiquinone reductase (Na(+)-transporting) subunit C [Bacteroidaceae bacterium]MBR1542729.1 NADH:ubiquinone reductase (Na(+)-transporting) subunit C [Bacteroidaceae bacterium]
MNTNSNSYTIIYAAVMVVIVAFLLSFVHSTFSSRQDANVELDTKKQILYSLNIRDSKDAEADYKKFVKADMLLKGDQLTENTGKFVTSFENDYKKNGNLHVFVAEIDGQTKYIFPVFGAGLWGSIWGYVTLNDDKDTVYATYFSHASETPGLGAEIQSYAAFQQQFEGKKVLNGGNVAIEVVKNGQAKGDINKVDGISGGTMTSNGVDAMLKDCLNNYKSFLNNK